MMVAARSKLGSNGVLSSGLQNEHRANEADTHQYTGGIEILIEGKKA